MRDLIEFEKGQIVGLMAAASSKTTMLRFLLLTWLRIGMKSIKVSLITWSGHHNRHLFLHFLARKNL